MYDSPDYVSAQTAKERFIDYDPDEYIDYEEDEEEERVNDYF